MCVFTKEGFASTKRLNADTHVDHLEIKFITRGTKAQLENLKHITGNLSRNTQPTSMKVEDSLYPLCNVT